MPPLVVPGALLVVLQWSQPNFMSHAPVNVLGITWATGQPWTQSNADQFTLDFNTNWASSGVGAAIAAGLDPVSITYTDIRTSTGPQFITTPVAATTAAGDPLPGETSIATSVNTALRGRSFRGRFYWPGVVESSNGADGRPSGVILTATSTFLQTWHNDIASNAFSDGIGVISRKLLTITPATGFVTDNTWDSQRRRGFA